MDCFICWYVPASRRGFHKYLLNKWTDSALWPHSDFLLCLSMLSTCQWPHCALGTEDRYARAKGRQVSGPLLCIDRSLGLLECCLYKYQEIRGILWRFYIFQKPKQPFMGLLRGVTELYMEAQGYWQCAHLSLYCGLHESLRLEFRSLISHARSFLASLTVFYCIFVLT